MMTAMKRTATRRMMMLSDEARLLEAILFIENQPTSLDRLCELTGLKPDMAEDALAELGDEYERREGGLLLTLDDDELYSFSPAVDLYPKLKASYGRKVDRRLSRAAMEILAIIAYGQPITRGEIEKIRGVGSDTIVKMLRDREYIMVKGRKNAPGHPWLYHTTKKFLHEFNLKSIQDLPKLSEIDKMRFEDKMSDEEDEEKEEDGTEDQG